MYHIVKYRLFIVYRFICFCVNQLRIEEFSGLTMTEGIFPR